MNNYSNQNIKIPGGIIETSNASSFNLSKTGFYNYVKANDYEKLGPGIYAPRGDISDELLVLHKRCPCGVISHDEALYHYRLIDREPLAHTITVYSGYNATRLRRSGYQVYYADKMLLNLGKQIVLTQFGNEIPMYDMERTIVDLVRNRSKFEVQDFSAALKTYAAMPEKNLLRLSEYAAAFRIEKILRIYMGVLL